MIGFLKTGGPFAWAIVLIAAVNLGLAARLAVALAAGRAGDCRRLDALLFWGAVAALLGLLGQALGIYNAMGAIMRATDISPPLIARGFLGSFTTTLLGLGALAASGLAWSVLRGWRGRIRERGRGGGSMERVLLTAAILLSLDVAGVGAAESPLAGGCWVGEVGDDAHAFVFRGDEGGLRGSVWWLKDGKGVNEMPCTGVDYAPPRLRLAMPTGVVVEGEVDLDAGLIAAEVVSPDGRRLPMPLRRRDPATLPGMTCRPAGEAYAYAPPPARDDGWPVAAAAALDVDAAGLTAAVEAVAAGRAGVIHSLLAARRGRLVLEEYFHGYGADDLHGLASCTKSVSALLVGLAVDAGAIAGAGLPLTTWFPTERYPRGGGWADPTLAHLLTMTLGLSWSAAEAEDVHGTGEDFFARVLARDAAGPPGRIWQYVNAQVDLLSGVLMTATGRGPEALAAEGLFAPLGITAYDWRYSAEGEHRLMDGSLRLRPRDMLKLGQLVLDEGRWRDARVLSEGWVREMTTGHASTGDDGFRYGYLWWRGEMPGGGGTTPVVFANGWGSQFICVFPELELVVVVTGGNQDNGKHMAPARTVLAAHLLPAVR